MGNPAAHAAYYAVFLQHLPVSLADVLAAAVTVKSQPTQIFSHLDCVAKRASILISSSMLVADLWFSII
ncbi:MAG: hypothetical protein CVU91_11350 [Firmicutes bacterium HGW-Firmicutes-16]|nr:MAG: hypothetical protein CVU91_11350 [Firmicutes bacterium HGW-Firmicutes-16]